MRIVLAAGLLLGAGLAACSPAREAAPPPAAAAPAAMPAASAAMPAAAGFDGHYVGSARPGAGAGCAINQNYDFTVASGQVTGTVVTSGRVGRGISGGGGRSASSDLAGTVDASGHAVLELHPQGLSGARGSLTGQFANGVFTGHRGPPCDREVTAKLS